MDILNLKKNDILDLSKVSDKLNIVDVGLGWDTRMDLDAIAFLLNDNDKVMSTVYFGDKESTGVRLNGDNLTGEGDGDDEIITVTFKDVPKAVTKIALYVNIYGATAGFFKKKNFGQVQGAYVRLVNHENGKELCRYSLTEDGRSYNAFHFANLVRNENGWSFTAIGKGCNGSVSELESIYR